MGGRIDRPRRARRLSAAGLAAVLVTLAASPAMGAGPGTGPGGARTASVPAPADGLRMPVECPERRDGPGGDARKVRQAEALVANRYRLGPHREVTLPADLTWRENPLRDANWLVRFHGLQWLRTLLAAWVITGDARFADRVRAVVADWVTDNLVTDPPTVWGWYGQPTAMRASVLACAAALIGLDTGLLVAIGAHADRLADERHYVRIGNHALDQSIGLMDLAWVAARDDWMRTARMRILRLVTDSVSPDGVSNEQSVGYALYNYGRYLDARDRFAAYGMVEPPGFDRVERMPEHLAWATLPDRAYDTIGDTSRERAFPIPGTIAEYAASGGLKGPVPGETVRLFPEGWLFGRTGWGTERPFADEVAWSLRFGPARVFHGHDDGGSITLYGHGARLVVDPGRATYNRGPWHDWFTGRTAHNVVVARGLRWSRSASPLASYAADAARVDARTVSTGYPGVRAERRLLFSRSLGYLLVEDRVRSGRPRDFDQLWHLPEDAAPAIAGGDVTTTRAGGNLLVRSLLHGDPRTVTGARDPIQGWVAWRYGERVAAPVVAIGKRGRVVRWITLLVTADGTPTARTDDLQVTRDGYAVTVTIGDRAERVVVDATGSTVMPVDPPPPPSPGPSPLPG